MSFSSLRIEDIQRSKKTDKNELQRLQSAAEQRGWSGGDIAKAVGIKSFDSRNDVQQGVDFVNNWYSQQQSSKAQAASTPEPTPAPQPSASVVEARQRAQEVAYSPAEQPKLFEKGTPPPGDAALATAEAANRQGEFNAKFSLAQKNIGDMAAENFDRQLAGFGSRLPNAPKSDDAMAGALAVVKRYQGMFG